MTAPESKTPNLRESRKEMAAAQKAAAGGRAQVTEHAGRASKGSAERAIGKSAEKKPPAKAAKKTAPPKKEGRGYPGRQPGTYYVRGSYKPVKGKKLYEATGESGQISVYSSSTVMTHAVSLAEPDRQGADHLKNGRICSMHGSKEAAEKMVERLMKDRDSDDHTRAVVVEAREYQGPVEAAKEDTTEKEKAQVG